MLAITAIEGPEDSHVRAKIGMPSIMDTINLLDMGRMNGNWASGGRTGSSRAPIAVAKRWPGP